METFSCNMMREAKDKINKLGIQKEDIVNIFTDKDGLIVVNYYVKD